MKQVGLTITLAILGFSLALSSENDTVNTYPNKIDFKTQKIGGYLTVEDFKNNTPSHEFKFKARKRLFPEILVLGGNDYKIARRDFQVAKSTVRHDLWGAWDGKHLYINNIKYTKVGKYFKVVPLNGKYYFVTAQSRKGDVIKWFTGAGMILGGIPGGINTTKRIAFEVNPESQHINIIDEEDMCKILGEETELYDEFSTHKRNHNCKVMMSYIEKKYESTMEN